VQSLAVPLATPRQVTVPHNPRCRTPSIRAFCPVPTAKPREGLQSGAEVKIGQYTFRVTDLLGRGCFSSVWSARHLDGASVAIKETLCKSPDELQAAEREAAILQSIVGAGKRSPDVIACETTVAEPGVKTVRIAMTQLPGESLSSFLENYKNSVSKTNAYAYVTNADESVASEASSKFTSAASKFTSALLSQLAPFVQSISAVALHRDISTENVLVSTSNGVSDPEFGLIDFGLAAQAESWPTMMTQVPVVGNCQYWPVSAWYIFMYGGQKLLGNDSLRMEYLKHLDSHALGILSLKVFMTMVPRSAYAHLPEEMRTLQYAWEHYCGEAKRRWDSMLRASQGQANYEAVRQAFIKEGADRIIESALTRLHRALTKVSEACTRAGPSSPLSNVGSLSAALTQLIRCGGSQPQFSHARCSSDNQMADRDGFAGTRFSQGRRITDPCIPTDFEQLKNSVDDIVVQEVVSKVPATLQRMVQKVAVSVPQVRTVESAVVPDFVRHGSVRRVRTADFTQHVPKVKVEGEIRSPSSFQRKVAPTAPRPMPIPNFGKIHEVAQCQSLSIRSQSAKPVGSGYHGRAAFKQGPRNFAAMVCAS